MDILRRGDAGAAVTALQSALCVAGYRVGVDGEFGPRTEMVVRQFQQQHGLAIDGEVGKLTAAALKLPHDQLVASAAPLVHASGFPHDDTASLIAFYGDPRGDLDTWKAANVVAVPCPWTLYYNGEKWPHPIEFHRKAAGALTQAFAAIWDAAGRDNQSPILAHVRNFSGSGNYRPVRGSSRLSCHAFWAALDFDAERLPMGARVSSTVMPQQVVDAFKSAGLFWGGDFVGRPDPMHVQAAHE